MGNGMWRDGRPHRASAASPIAPPRARRLTAMASTSRKVASGRGSLDEDDAARAATERPPDSSRARLDLLPAVGPVVVMLVAGAALLSTTWSPVGDYALAEIIVRHATAHPPLFGPYSATRPYHHPLPLGYALVWGPYELFGRRSSAQLAATVWFNGLLLGLIVWLTARRRALGLGLALLAGIALFATNSAPGHLSIPWNPFLGFVPTIALAVATWRCALGDRWSLPLVAGLATWSAGVHIAYAPTVAGLVSVAIIGIIVSTARKRTGWPAQADRAGRVVDRGGRGAVVTGVARPRDPRHAQQPVAHPALVAAPQWTDDPDT